MSRLTYFLILLLSYFDFLHIMPLGPILEFGRGFVGLIFQLVWFLIGALKYRNGKRMGLYTDTNRSFIWRLYIYLIPSMMMASYLFDQSFTQNIVSYRNFLTFLSIPVLLKAGFPTKTIIKGCVIFSYLYIFAAIWRTYVSFPLFYFTEPLEKMYMSIKRGTVSEFLVSEAEGIQIMLIPLYYYCGKIIRRFSFKSLVNILILLTFVIVMQNRSTLFPAVIISLYSLIRMKSRYPIFKLLFLVPLLWIIITSAADIIINLIDQTTTELDTSYDPRAKAREYFLDFNRLSILEILFGTGIISFNTSKYVEILQASHIHYSDVGFIGFWSQCGILPIILFSKYLIKALFNKTIPLYVKFLSFQIILCAMTISYFEAPSHIIWYVLFYYLYCYYKSRRQRYAKVTYNDYESVGNNNSGLQTDISEKDTQLDSQSER